MEGGTFPGRVGGFIADVFCPIVSDVPDVLLMFGNIFIRVIMELKVAAVLNQLDKFLREVAERFRYGGVTHNGWGFFLDVAFKMPTTAPIGQARLIPSPMVFSAEFVSMTGSICGAIRMPARAPNAIGMTNPKAE